MQLAIIRDYQALEFWIWGFCDALNMVIKYGHDLDFGYLFIRCLTSLSVKYEGETRQLSQRN